MKKQNKTKIIELTVKGMTCRHCAEKVKSAITKVKGVEYTEVDYQKGFASVVAESATNESEIIFSISNAGYSAEIKNITFKEEAEDKQKK